VLRVLPGVCRKAGTAIRSLPTAVAHRFTPAGQKGAKAGQTCPPHTSARANEPRPARPASIARRSAKTTMLIAAQKNGSKPPA
jgi:hypothetical protein